MQAAGYFAPSPGLDEPGLRTRTDRLGSVAAPILFAASVSAQAEVSGAAVSGGRFPSAKVGNSALICKTAAASAARRLGFCGTAIFAYFCAVQSKKKMNFLQRIPPVVRNLLIINVILWAVPAFIPSLGRTMENYLALHYFTSPGFNVAQLVTYMFLHAGLGHLFFNMFALVVFGAPIEWTMGSRRFLFYYITCGIVAGLVQMGVFAVMIDKYTTMFSAAEYDEIIRRGWELMRQGYNFTDPTLGTLNALVNTPMVGASGAVYGVILALGMLFPNQPMYLFFIPYPIKAKWLVIGYAVIELAQGMGNMVTNVAHFAHLGGMIAGVVLILYWRRRGVFNNHWFF